MDKFVEYYRLLGLEMGADEAAVRKAYKRLALKLHPDKNPDDPRAADKFDAVNKAYEALTDNALRKELEAKMAAKAAADARASAMDATRRKLREDLEARERAAAATVAAGRAAAAAESRQRHIERLRQDNKERVEALRAQRAGGAPVAAAAAAASSPSVGGAGVTVDGVPISGDGSTRPSAAAGAPSAGASSSSFHLDCALRVKWDAAVNDDVGAEEVAEGDHDADDDAMGGARSSGAGAAKRVLSEEQITAVFRPFGGVLAVLSRKPTSAVVVMETKAGTRAALAAARPAGFKWTSVTPDVGAASAAAADGDDVAAPDSSTSTAGYKRKRSDMSGASDASAAAPPSAAASGVAAGGVGGARPAGGGGGLEAGYAALCAREAAVLDKLRRVDALQQQRAAAAIVDGGVDGVGGPT